jgi:predicted nucleic acid-binding protein
VRVLVSDASILIELAKWSLLQALFALPFEFAVPDALYEDELIDLGDLDREQLKGLGLRVESLDPVGMARAVAYQTARPKFTFHDCLAVTLAVTNDWPLLTGDRRMRALAEEEHLEVHGVPWIIVRFAEHRIVDRPTLANALRGMLEDPRTRLPQAEINKRLALVTAEDA